MELLKVHEPVSQEQVRDWQIEMVRKAKNFTIPASELHDFLHYRYADMANTSDQVIIEIAEVYLLRTFDTSSTAAYDQGVRTHLQAVAVLLDIVYMTRALG